jgi:regulator of protease activity HflC (stomatin/prohibitin superfamily)
MRRITVMEWERVVRYRRGRFAGVLEPGRYWLRGRDRVLRVDLRPRTVTLPGQEVLTADGVPVRATLALVTRVTDPVAYVQGAVAADQAVYVALQLALRATLTTVTAEDLLGARRDVDEALLAGSATTAAAYGLAVEQAGIRDLAFPGDLKRVFAQVAAARQEAKAALERARGETAALRSLANAARAIEAQPALLRLRTLQAVEGTSGATVVLTDR